jgi:predicted Zn-dependent protease with MMP-like domain
MQSRQPRTTDEFEDAAQAVWDNLPEEFRAVVGNLSIQIHDFASRATLDHMRIHDEYGLLGLYHGVGLPYKSTWDIPRGPDMIFLYRIPILAYAHRHLLPIETVVRHVLIHEVGHHFGLSDADMAAIEATT